MVGRILVVDDTPSARELIEAALEPEGYEILLATNGFEALAALEQTRPDLVLLDVMMPGMDGLEVCRRIRADPRWRTLPVILITALQAQEHRLEGLEAGADEFVTKPVDISELLIRVRNTVHLARLRRQLRERERFEWVVMHSASGFVWLDAAGRVLGANPVADQWLNIQAYQVAHGHSDWLAVVRPFFRIVPETSWVALAQAGEPFTLTLIRPADGEWPDFWLHVSGSPLEGAEPGTVEWMLHLEDVTERQRQLQTTLTLTTMVAHKLRTPLALIKGPIELIAHGELEPGDEEWDEFLSMAATNVERLEDAVTKMFEMVALWEKPLNHWQYDRADAQTLSALFAGLGKEFGLDEEHYVVEVQAPQPVKIQPQVLRLIAEQLLDNAVKFHPEHRPTVFIRLETAGKSLLRMSVEDDGPGIPPEHRSRVWRPLYQLDRDQAGQVPGVGLGLSQVANWVWAWGGDVWIEDGDLSGSRICLEFPEFPMPQS